MSPGSRRMCKCLLASGLSVLLYLFSVTGYAVWSYHHQKTHLLAQIDSDLLQAARSLKYLLPTDFHDRALDPHSIPMDEELRNRKLVTEFGVESGFKWVYTLVQKDGAFFFSAPSVSEEEARERESWYFYPYDDIPPTFINAFQHNAPAFVNYTDQWGSFRSVALPQQSPAGRRYLACADREISEINRQLRADLLQSVLVALFFLLASLPFLLLITYIFCSHNQALKSLNAELQSHKEHLEDLVKARTAELESQTHQLQKALDNIKVLGGLLPICASCKKIRDDEGYWNQLEHYIQMNTDAVFSHGLCPDCIQKLYADLPESPPPPNPPVA